MELAVYATHAEKTKGRLYPEKEYAERTCFQRDRDRIIHSEAFRRLESKTQVFVYHEGNSLRRRLTHSLEVAQITRSLCRMLNLDQDLGEAIALCHDLGHPPFGHAGEKALNECMKQYGGFDHNAHSLKIVTSLECKYPSFDGINLCWETLEGVIKHNGPLGGPDICDVPDYYISLYNEKHDLQLDTFPGLEAQIASLADDIAYCNHDTDDGLKTQFISVEQLSEEVPFFNRHYMRVKKEYPDINDRRAASETVRRMINDLILDVASVTRRRLDDLAPGSVEDVRSCGELIVGFSPSVRTDMKLLKSFLFENMYRHYKINQMTSKGKRILRDLFSLFFQETNILPTDIQQRLKHEEHGARNPETVRARIISDFIAGLTDATAIATHARLFNAETRL